MAWSGWNGKFESATAGLALAGENEADARRHRLVSPQSENYFKKSAIALFWSGVVLKGFA